MTIAIDNVHSDSASALSNIERLLVLLAAIQDESSKDSLARLIRLVGTQIEGRPTSEYEAQECEVLVRTNLAAMASNMRSEVSRKRGEGEDLDGTDTEGSALWVTTFFGSVLENMGVAGRHYSTQIQEEQGRAWGQFCMGGLSDSDPWRFWLTKSENTGEFPFLFVLVLAVWYDKVRPLMAGRPRAKSAALSTAVLNGVVNAFWKRDRKVELVEGRSIIVTTSAKPVATIEGPAIQPEVLRATRTLPAHRLLRFLIAESYRMRIEGVAEYYRVTIPRGFSGLALRLHMSSSRAADELRQAMEAFQVIRIELPSQTVGGLLTWDLRTSRPGRPAELRIMLGAPLLPEYVVGLSRGGVTQQLARKVVPIPSRFPALVGHPQFHSSQAVLQMLVLREFRLNASELVRSGSVSINREQWERLAEEAELPAYILPELVSAYGRDNPRCRYRNESPGNTCR